MIALDDDAKTLATAKLIGDRVRELRRAAGLTQAEVARRSGIVRPNVARIENARYGRKGNALPTTTTIVRLARAIGVQPSEVYAVLDEGVFVRARDTGGARAAAELLVEPLPLVGGGLLDSVRILDLEARVAKLEATAHAPVDLRPIAREIVREELATPYRPKPGARR